jgi:hypothetical protein
MSRSRTVPSAEALEVYPAREPRGHRPQAEPKPFRVLTDAVYVLNRGLPHAVDFWRAG